MIIKKRNKEQAKRLKLLSEYLTISKIAELTKRSPKTIYKAFSNYREKGWINKDRSLTSKGVKKVELAFVRVEKGESKSRITQLKSNTIRLHNLAFTINLPKPFSKINKFLELKNISYKTINMGTWNIKQIVIDNRKVWINPKKLILYMGSYYSDIPLNAFIQALNELKSLVFKIQRMFNIKLIKGNSIDFEVSRQHYSLIKNQLAKEYNKKKKKLYVYDTNNRLRLLIDNSLNLHEFEAVDNKLSKEDMEKVQPYFLDVLEKEHYLPSNSKEMLDILVKENLKLAQNFTAYNQNIKKHLKVLDSMDKTLKIIRGEKTKKEKKLPENQTRLFT
jgi:hypothetical protein